MNELSLFTGAGGGVLGTKLLGFRHIGYVENNPYCQKVLKARIADGVLDEAPIFGDIRKFINDGFAAMFNGMADVVTAGFPCQPFSVAGKGLAENDPRNMWPETIEVIRQVRPRYALLENVPGLLNKPYFRRILRQIVESGYDCKWGVLGADDIGACQHRKRLFLLLADAKSQQDRRVQSRRFQSHISTGCANVANPEHGRLSKRRRAITACEEVSELRGISGNDAAARCVEEGEVLAHTNGQRLQGEGQRVRGQKTFPCVEPRSNAGEWWATEPALGRVANGVASRVDRLKAIGNGQVPAVVKAIWGLMAA